MTREEARILLKKTKPKDNNAMSIMLREAMDMAIKALEQEPCEDAISREAVLEAIHEADMNAYDEASFVRDLRNNINEIPSVYPKQKTGYWVEENINEWSRKVFCSECGCPPPFEHVSNGDVYSESGYGVVKI